MRKILINLGIEHIRNSQYPRAEIRCPHKSPFPQACDPHLEGRKESWLTERLSCCGVTCRKSVLQNLPEISLLKSRESYSWGDVSSEAICFETTHECAGGAVGPWVLLLLYCRSLVLEKPLVLKCRFYYSGLVRSTDQEMTAIEKVVCYTAQEEGNMPWRRAGWHMGRH